MMTNGGIMIQCPDCNGRGYNIVTVVSGELKVIKEWCIKCKGTGMIKLPPENRDGMEWERE